MKHKQVLKTLHDFSTKIINERKEYHKRTNDEYLKDLELPLGKQELDDKLESDHIKSKIIHFLNVYNIEILIQIAFLFFNFCIF